MWDPGFRREVGSESSRMVEVAAGGHFGLTVERGGMDNGEDEGRPPLVASCADGTYRCPLVWCAFGLVG